MRTARGVYRSPAGSVEEHGIVKHVSAAPAIVALSVALGVLGCNGRKGAEKPAVRSFEAASLRVVIYGSELTGPLEEHRGEWSAQTGASVEWAVHSADADPERADALPGDLRAADILIYPADWLGSLAAQDLLKPVPDDLLSDPAYDREDLLAAFRERLCRWGETTLALPYSGNGPLLFYRKDVLTNPAHRDAFRAKLGRVLVPPATWTQYLETAAFFASIDWRGDGEKGYGVVEPLGGHGRSLARLFFAHAAAYAKHPEHYSFFFDVGSFKPLVDTPPFVRALDDLRALRSAGPPNMLTLDRAGSRGVFLSGKAALTIDDGELVPVALAGSGSAKDSAASAVVGKIGVAPLPGAEEAYNPTRRDWDRLGASHRIAYVGQGGFLASVTRSSKHEKAAFDLLRRLTGKDWSLQDVALAGSWIGPYRSSHLDAADGWLPRGMGRDEARGWVSALRTSLGDRAALADLRIRGSLQYYDRLGVELAQALSDRKPTAEALHQVVESWSAISKDLGAADQLREYRRSLGLSVPTTTLAPTR